jgi:hypothetical protein
VKSCRGSRSNASGLHQLVPDTSVIAVLRDPNSPEFEAESRDLEETGHAIGRQILMVNVVNEREFHGACKNRVNGHRRATHRQQSILPQPTTCSAGGPACPADCVGYNQREYAEAGRAKHGIARAGPARASAERTSAGSRPARQPPEPAAEAPLLAPVSEERPAPLPRLRPNGCRRCRWLARATRSPRSTR